MEGTKFNMNRNDRCWCKSGLKYKNCHLLIDSAIGEDKIKISKELYAKNWLKSTDNLNSQGCYNWIISKIKKYNPKNVFDIGCGDGTGLIKLIEELNNKDIYVIASEDNPECIRMAENKLRALSQYSLKTVFRYSNKLDNNEFYFKEIINSEIAANSQINIIESNILFDQIFVEYLKSLPKFDLVTVWLIGTHTMQNHCLNFNVEIKTVGDYRLRVQNRVYEIADVILKTGGILQVVDRSEPLNTIEKKEDIIRAHKEQASVTSLKYQEIDYLEYKEIEVKRKMGLQLTLGTSGRLPEEDKISIVSVIFGK